MSLQKVAIQGIRGCFHEMAAQKYFGSDVSVLECMTFRDVCLHTVEGNSDYGIMAIENTLAGSLLPNYGLIEKFDLKIIGEVYLPIRMNLMAVKGAKITDIRSVTSHPVALAQCEVFLEKLNGVKVLEYHDTAAAAKMVSESAETHRAAISSRLSAELYGLNILAEDIETHKQNFTRFLILANLAELSVNDNKASISLELAHRPGSLADVLQIFKDYKVNLTKIQSLPIIGKPYQYAFKIDLTWQEKSALDESLSKIVGLGNEVKINGVYREGEINLKLDY